MQMAGDEVPCPPWPAEAIKVGAVAKVLPELMDRFGYRRAFLMVSRSLRQQTTVVADTVRALGAACVGVYDGMPQHTPREEVLSCVRSVRDLAADVVVTIGGGSLTDAAKAVQICAAYGVQTSADMNPLRGWSVPACAQKTGEPKLPLRYIAVPTTLSAGEHTNVAGVTNTKRRRKEPLFHSKCSAQAIILDAELARHTPMWLWLSTGVRAVDHCRHRPQPTLTTPVSRPCASCRSRRGRARRSRTGWPLLGSVCWTAG
eukprot:TRINITY_DN3040_c0_g1_i3.p2 TRINITY_DN3040_c0_g1~~TRINITY_DN3040_c0_g1_i3.p2  ORF type:complete len:276 (+),score=67.48 TRINITY_DN3040_c0_g1_i3:53-829(+)